MIKNNSINTLYSQKIVIFLVLVPIFISLDISNGINFDAYYFKSYKYPSIPISLILIAFISFINLKFLVKKEINFLIFFIGIYIILNLFFGQTRAIIVGFGMILPILSYMIFKNSFNKIEYKNIFYLFFIIIFIKFLFDIYLYSWSFFYEPYIGQETQKTIFNTIYFLNTNFVIYNFYDYFSFLYFAAAVFSVFNIIKKQFIKSSILLFIINIVILDTGSRLFIYGLYLIPFLLLFLYITNYSLKTYFIFFISIVSIISLTLGFFNFNIPDVSLFVRNYHALNYFDNFSLINIILPFFNEHRMNTTSSLHNELLEIWSFFGLITFYYLYLLKEIFTNINEEYKIIGFLLMFILVIGMLIQINFSNPYVGIIFGMIFGVLSRNKECLHE